MDKIIELGLLGVGILGAGYLINEYLNKSGSGSSIMPPASIIGSSGGSLGSVISTIIPNNSSNTKTSSSIIPSNNTATNGQSINVSAYNPAQPVSITAYGSSQPIIATPVSTTQNTQTVSLTGGGTAQLSNELNMNLSSITMPKSTAGYSGNTTAGLVNALSEEQTAYNLLGTANVQKYGYKTTTNSQGQVVYSLG